MSNPTDPHASADIAARVERRWAVAMVLLVSVMVAMVVFTGLHWAMMPPSRVEIVDPTTLHVTGEFVETNLGSAVESDGSVTVRVVAQEYSFTPQCLLVPAGVPITFRGTSADVIHGFLITDTNLNTMLEPGYVSTFRTEFDRTGDHLMPCHEFCGPGHQGMWAHVKVIDKDSFMQMAQAAGNARRLSCVK
jgi:cytochrome c oxidase subunit II